MSKQRFASQVNVNKNLSKPVTQHYLPKKTESAFAKPDHMIASSSSMNSSKNMPRFSSNDMIHNHYLDVAKKKIQDRDRNSTTSIFTGHRFSPNKTSAVYEKTSPRSDLRRKTTGRIFKFVGLRWIPTGKLFDSCTSKVNSEPPHGSNVDILNIHECKQTLDVSAGKSQSMAGEKADISETIVNVDSQMMIRNNDIKPRTSMSDDICTKRFNPRTTMSTKVHQAAESVTTSNELDLLFDPLFDEYFNGVNQVVSKSFAVTTTDASNKCQHQHDSTSSTLSPATTVTANENFNL
ncbi:hypothetical protein Tco_1212168 [Tanacetum coccineum]